MRVSSCSSSRSGDAGPSADPERHIERWPDASEDHVGGKLHEHVTHVQDRDSRIELIAFKAQIFLEVVELGLA